MSSPILLHALNLAIISHICSLNRQANIKARFLDQHILYKLYLQGCSDKISFLIHLEL